MHTHTDTHKQTCVHTFKYEHSKLYLLSLHEFHFQICIIFFHRVLPIIASPETYPHPVIPRTLFSPPVFPSPLSSIPKLCAVLFLFSTALSSPSRRNLCSLSLSFPLPLSSPSSSYPLLSLSVLSFTTLSPFSESPAFNVGGHVESICNGLSVCAEANLDVQYIMALAQNVPTT